MILIVKTNKEKLHDLEFVQPIINILEKNKTEYFVKHYNDLYENDIILADKIILAGTSLKDNDFLEDIWKLEWIKECDKPILGICAGMHILGLIFGEKLKGNQEIGEIKINFDEEFLGLNGEENVFVLHNKFVDFGKDWEIFAKTKCPQAVKHKEKEIYGTLFHPEVKNEILIKNFIDKL